MNKLVNKWEDISGNGFNCSNSGDNRPMYVEEGPNGYPSIFFEYGRSELRFPLYRDVSAYTLFMVMSVEEYDNSNNRRFFTFGNIGAGILNAGRGFSGVTDALDTSSRSAFSNETFNYGLENLNIVMFSFGNKKPEVRINGSLARALANQWWGARPDESAIGKLPISYVSEVVLYDRVLDETEIDSILTFLSVKYGVDVS